MVDYAALKFWLDLVQYLVTVALAIFVWVNRGRSDNKSAIGRLENRVLTLEEQQRHSPTHEDITRLREESSALNSKLDRVTHTVDQIHEYLLNNK